MAKKSEGHAGAVVAIATIAAAAGAYFLYGSKDATKNRKAVKSWALKAKGEVLEKLEKAKEINEESYHTIVDTVMKKYANLKDSKEEVDAVITDLKSHWKNIKKHVKSDTKAVAKTAKAGAKKVVKKATK